MYLKKCHWKKWRILIVWISSRSQYIQHEIRFQSLSFGNGRIPVVIIVEAEWSAENISFSIRRERIARGINAGLVSGKEVWTVKECVNKTCSGAFDGARMLSLDSTVDAMILHVTDNQVMRNGWPVEWCDVLLVGREQTEHRNSSYSPLE